MAENFRTEPKFIQYGATALALKDDSTVWAWGKNTSGVLGNPSVELGDTNFIPSQVIGLEGKDHLTNIKTISLESHVAAAILEDDHICMWGDNKHGQLGNGSIQDTCNVPTLVKGLDGVGYLSGVKKLCRYTTQETIALLNDGRVCGWGYQTGYENSTKINTSSVPQLLYSNTLTNIIDIAASSYAHFALKSDGTILAWGNATGCGAGTQYGLYIDSPQKIITASGDPLSDIVKIHRSFAIDSKGKVYAWGYTYNGQIGTGNVTNEYQYFATPILCEDKHTELLDIVELSSHNYTNIAVNSKGEAYVWGMPQDGQIGLDPSMHPSALYYATRSPELDSAWIRSPFSASFARPDGTVWMVGNMAYDLANDGESGSTHIPQQVFETPGGKPFLLFGDGEPIVPPDPGPDPNPGDCNKCCDCCCRPIVFNGPVTGPVNIYCNGNCKVSCEDKTKE